jgi:hypothetical protein
VNVPRVLERHGDIVNTGKASANVMQVLEKSKKIFPRVSKGRETDNQSNG